MSRTEPDVPLETLVIPGSALLVAERGELGSGAAAVVVQLGTEAAAEGTADLAVLDWLRSPARLSIATLTGACAPHEMTIALACDLMVMARSATVTLASHEVPAAGVLERLVSRVGSSTALMLALRSSTVDADEAYATHLVDAVADDDELDSIVAELVESLASRPPGWFGEVTSLIAAATGPQHEPPGRSRLRRWEADAAERLAEPDRQDD